MEAPALRNERQILFMWAMALITAVLALTAFNAVLAHHAHLARENDYRSFLADAALRYENNDLVGAAENVDRARRKAPTAPEPDVMAGHIHYKLKQWEPAIAAYRTALSKGSQDEGIVLNIVWALIELERYQEAVEFGRANMKHGLDNPSLPRYVAEALFRDGRRVESIPYFEQALEHYPHDLYLLEHIRQAYEAADAPDKMAAIAGRIEEVLAAVNTAVDTAAPPAP